MSGKNGKGNFSSPQIHLRCGTSPLPRGRTAEGDESSPRSSSRSRGPSALRPRYRRAVADQRQKHQPPPQSRFFFFNSQRSSGPGQGHDHRPVRRAGTNLHVSPARRTHEPRRQHAGAPLGGSTEERVAMPIGNRVEFVEFFFGAMRMGAIPDTSLTRDSSRGHTEGPDRRRGPCIGHRRSVLQTRTRSRLRPKRR